MSTVISAYWSIMNFSMLVFNLSSIFLFWFIFSDIPMQTLVQLISRMHLSICLAPNMPTSQLFTFTLNSCFLSIKNCTKRHTSTLCTSFVARVHFYCLVWSLLMHTGRSNWCRKYSNQWLVIWHWTMIVSSSPFSVRYVWIKSLSLLHSTQLWFIFRLL